MKDYKYIFFDLDGTITESGPSITSSVAYALDKLGVPVGDPARAEQICRSPSGRILHKILWTVC